MSLRYFSLRLLKNGRQLFRIIYKRELSANMYDKNQAPNIIRTNQKSLENKSFVLRGVGDRARSLLSEAILGKVTSSISDDLRSKATRKFMFGETVPFFSLVGITVASGPGMLTREDDLEALCMDIRETILKFNWNTVSLDANEGVFALEDITLDRLTIGAPIATGCSAAVYSAKLKEETDVALNPELLNDFSKFPFALKMMFNYDNSNAMSILREMYNEIVPVRRYLSNDALSQWESELPGKRVYIPPHPHIVPMYSAFVAAVPLLAEAMSLYPAALPARLNPTGHGRDRSLFLLMKRYQYSLVKYLELQKLPALTSVILFTQLLEAITHINLYGVAHRDLKSDNILIDVSNSDGEYDVPMLVLTDFGCCVADYLNGLQIPFYSVEIDRGGNGALMAPEIITQVPGPFSVLDYTKSDLWAAGTIAYEIFGSANPFYVSDETRTPIRLSSTYKEEELPNMEDHVPPLIKNLVKAILVRKPNKRPSTEVAANVCQLYLWAPSNWIKTKKMPSSTEIIQWLLCLTTKVLYEGRLPDNYPYEGIPVNSVSSIKAVANILTNKSKKRHSAEYTLISSFLGRVKLVQIKKALSWIHRNNESVIL